MGICKHWMWLPVMLPGPSGDNGTSPRNPNALRGIPFYAEVIHNGMQTSYSRGSRRDPVVRQGYPVLLHGMRREMDRAARESGCAMTMRVCSKPGCPNLHDGRGMCPSCRARADKIRRPHGNPYNTRGHQTFREAVLTRDPICVLCRKAQATVADHYPLDRVDLIEQGLDPNDPKHGRGLCKRCHDQHTAHTKPAGWNERAAD